DFRCEMSTFDRCLRPALALEREAVRFLARDAVLAREYLRRLAHDQVRERALESVSIHGVDERKVPHLVTPARVDGVDEVRHAAHRLDATVENEFGLAELARLSTGRYSVCTRISGLVYRQER